MNELKIDEELKNLIPPLKDDEFKQLEDNCLEEGIREKIITWNGFIIDGHNRYKVAIKWKLDYETESKHFNSKVDAKIWMIYNQFGRRNLSLYTRTNLALELKSVFREKAIENLSKGGGDRKSINKKSPLQISADPIDTRQELAKIADVSHDTIYKAEKIKEKGSDELKEKLATEDISVNKAYQIIKSEEKLRKFNEEKELFEAEVWTKNLNQEILLGDSINILPTLEKGSFDLLLTDPPYGMDFKSGWSNKEKIANDKIVDTVSLFEDVLRESVPLLKDDAHFYLFGNIDYMNDIKPIVEKYLTLKNILIWDRKVIGMGDLKTYGNSYDIIYFGYNKTWKDLNGTRDRDVLSYSRIDPSKNIHPTEKPLDILEYLIKKSSNENDKVLEPFAGGGSTLMACKNINRLATGIEIEEEYYNLINKRI